MLPAQFDADVSLPSTLFPFLSFLTLVPVLFSWAYLPLLPLAWRHARAIASFASASQVLREKWWSRRRSWIGGPIWRWAVGWMWGEHVSRGTCCDETC